MQKFEILRQPLLGDHVPGLHTRDPTLRPPSTWAEFFLHTFLQNNLQTSPIAPLESYPGFQPQKWTTFSHFLVKILLLLLLRSPCKNVKLYDTPFWSFNNQDNKKRNNKKRKNTKNKWRPSTVAAATAVHALRSDHNSGHLPWSLPNRSHRHNREF